MLKELLFLTHLIRRSPSFDINGRPNKTLVALGHPGQHHCGFTVSLTEQGGFRIALIIALALGTK
jgi:hypothetical protein